MIIGLDVGGTHTDVILLDKDKLVKAIKVITDTSDLFKTVLTGLDNITEGIEPERINRLVLSTTLTTNAIVQDKVPQVGMIVSSGPGIDPELFRTNQYYTPVSGSIDHRGREIKPVDKNEVKKAAKLIQAGGIKYAGAIGKFSTRNPAHEIKIKEILQDSCEKVFMGHRASGNLNFPRRIATTFLNASAYPLHKKFFEAVKGSLKKKGLNVPIHILKADGGTMSLESSIDTPGQTILSGPAASVMGAIPFAADNEDVIVLDIGGTTTDIAVLINRVPVLAPLGIELGLFKTLIRSLQTHSIGQGGDSLVRASKGKLQIGPDRMGPAMAYGGPEPTPTDALFVLGKAENGDKEKSIKGIEPIAADLGISLENAAFKIFDQTCKNILWEAEAMIDRINSKPVYTIHEILEGYQVKPKKILVLGGPAFYFAQHLESISDYETSPVPRWDVANAIGAALARTTCEVSLFADTQQGIVSASEEGYTESIKKNFSKRDALEKAYELLNKKALQKGASAADLEMEVLEEQEFNMVRGFYTAGKNIRVKVQIKPGLIQGYNEITSNLSSGVEAERIS